MSATIAQAREQLRTDLAALRRDRVLPVYAALAVLLGAYAAYSLLRPAGYQNSWIDGWGVDAFELTASFLCIRAGLRRRRGRAVPLVLGAALASWAIGDTVLTIETLGGAVAPSPSVADAFYLTFFPLSYVAVFLFVRGETRLLSSVSWLDGAVAGLGAAAVLSAFAFGAIERTTDLPVLGAIVNLAYPVGDVILLLLVVGGTAVMSGRRKGPWLLLALGFAVNVIGDSSNLLHETVGGAQVGTFLDSVAWPTSSLLLSLAMWLRPGTVDPLAPRKQPGFLLPGLAAGAGLTVLFIGSIAQVDRIATALGTATLVAVVLRTGLSVRALRAQTRRRHRQSITDHLTGLPNRRRLFDTLQALLSMPADERSPFAFLFIDLNGFKHINDSFGHPVGDDVLGRVGQRLQEALRPTDILARVGGDEFAAVILDADGTEAVALARRLTERLEAPFTLDAVRARIGASVGVALAPSDADTPDTLMTCADAAMYRAKLARLPFACYDADLDRGGNKLRLADELSAAIDSGQLTLHYQPLLGIADQQITTVEALVRWEHPRHGLIPPLTFIPLAEQAGLMQRLTRWVLDTALAQCAAWEDSDRWLRVSVNVSATDLVDPAFPDMVAERLEAARVPAAQLIIEITETSIIKEFERAKHAVARLRELGVQVAIDDFGAGFTSLAYLNDLAVGELKLDRRFIRPLTGGQRSRDSELVRATIELGHALGLQVVAEGVEDRGALELLGQLGCDIAQGYDIGRPVPPAELELRLEPEASISRPDPAPAVALHQPAAAAARLS